MELNNYLQAVYRRQELIIWEIERDGLLHQCTWTAIAYCMFFYENQQNLSYSNHPHYKSTELNMVAAVPEQFVLLRKRLPVKF